MARETLRVDGNEGSRPSEKLLASVAGRSVDLLRSYPDVMPLRRAIAERHRVDLSRVVVTAGADEAIDRVFRAFSGPARNVVVATPTFEMIYRFAESVGAELRTMPWHDGFPLDALDGYVDSATGIVVVISPNNPTGGVVTARDLRAISAAANDSVVLFDHVYADYADEDLSDVAASLPNVVLLRTFSKAWGLAGCRVGYAIASPDIAAIIRNIANPYPVSALSARLALDRMGEGSEAIRPHAEQVRDERRRLTTSLRDRGIQVRDSQGNFVLAEFESRAPFVHRAMASLGVLVRNFPSRDGLRTALRITLPGSVVAFERLQRALDTVLDPEALLFDMDGVLADVERSYGRTVLETLASFGVSLHRDELRRAAMGGDANNDWVLCQRLLGERGRQVSLEEVTDRFQGLYLGSERTAGYREDEGLLVPKTTLEHWSARLPLAIVTGRPRVEAEWFLERFELSELFSALVAMEDAPAKPDPAPVLLALEQLGVERAWMIGDTPDDVVAARRGGVVPVAALAPADRGTDAGSRLREAGAAVVLERTSDVEALL